MKEINPFELVTKPCNDWEHGWFLLTAGDFASGKYNTMTVAWGGMGILWGVPFVQVVVRPTRYTFDFMNQYDTFTLTAFPHEYERTLSMMGSISGRDNDKIAASGLTVVASQVVAAPTFTEAKLSIECKKIYWQDMVPANFSKPGIEEMYKAGDYHRFFFGEMMHIQGTEEYC